MDSQPPAEQLPAPVGASTITPKAKITLTGVSKTMLPTLSARAQDFALGSQSVLRDSWAAAVLDRLAYTRPRTMADVGFNGAVLLRGRLFDTWTTDFLEAHPQATVLHLACGLDSRAHRVAAWRKPGVRWIDVDMPGVVELRREVLPDPDQGDYRLLAASVTDEGWLEDIPADRPTLVLMEGLMMYLEKAVAEKLLQRLTDRFPSGQVVLDIVGTMFLRLQALNGPIRQTGASLFLGLNDVKEVEAMNPKLRNCGSLNLSEIPGLEILPWSIRAAVWLYSWLPSFWSMATYMRLEF